MSKMSNYLENELIDHIFRGRSYSSPTQEASGAPTIYIGLFTTDPTDANSGSEVSTSSTGYARVNVGYQNISSRMLFEGTGGEFTLGSDSGGTGGLTSNHTTITFGTPTANWGTITHWGIFDASTGGNLLCYGQFTTAKNVNNGDAAPTIAANALQITLA